MFGKKVADALTEDELLTLIVGLDLFLKKDRERRDVAVKDRDHGTNVAFLDKRINATQKLKRKIGRILDK